MADIKTREIMKGTIKTFDRADAAAHRIKDSSIRTKESTEEAYQAKEDLILSRLVDTFFSRISLTMPLPPKFHNTAYVLLWEEDLHWQSRSSGCSSS